MAEVVEAAARPSGDRDEIIELNLKIEFAGQELARHEPPAGAFLGAYVARDNRAGDIRAFEAATGVNHAIFAYTMALEDEYPLRWVLENIAAGKAPFITLLPVEAEALAGRETVTKLREFAANVGQFNVPAFVQLFPLIGDHGFNFAEYTAFFRAAHSVFAHYAPNVALVWGFDTQNLADSVRFYPGRDAVDWIHLINPSPISPSGEFGDFFSYLNFFYFAYQHERPLMVSVAVSHYSAESNAYFTHEAAAKIQNIFGRLEEYPRIKAVIYRSYNDLAASGNKFGLTGVPIISQAYAEVSSSPHFLSFVENTNFPRVATQIIRSPFRAIMWNYYFYIPMRALAYDARLLWEQLESLKNLAREINGEFFVCMADVHEITGADFFVDFQRRLLVLRYS